MNLSKRAGLILTLALYLCVTPGFLLKAGAEDFKQNELWITKGGIDFKGWQLNGTRVAGEELKLAPDSLKTGTDPFGEGGYNGGNYFNGTSYRFGEALAPFHAPSGGFDNLVLSWNASTPSGTWVMFKIKALVGNQWTREYVMGIWAAEDGTIRRHSENGQSDINGKVSTDTLLLNHRATAFQAHVILFTTRPDTSPSISLVAVSTLRKGAVQGLPSPRLWNKELAVPERSQMIYPGGGEVWCSPTSASMVMAYWGQITGRGELNQTVPFAAAHTNDWIFQGNGNWPFNTALAGSFGLTAYVSRFNSLSQVEPWIEKGIPVIASIAYRPGELSGTPISTTDGHLLVIRGFDQAGNVIVNDPAADPRQGEKVRIIYNRAQFEKVWQNGSEGMVYLIYPPGHPIPGGELAFGAWPSISIPFADPEIFNIWQKGDGGVGGENKRSWTWGPGPNTPAISEPYREGFEGSRLVQYFDKSRMEVTHPESNRGDKWFVTNGLLTIELVAGKTQLGDNLYRDSSPAQIPVAGDFDSPQSPTYATFQGLASLPGNANEKRAKESKGKLITSLLGRDGRIGEAQTPPPIKAAYFDTDLGHNIPDVFWNWINDPKNGLDWLFTLGHPITEPYWVNVNVKGKPSLVLVQLFERRVLTFNPENELRWQVEMGNIGQHYYHWRYS